MFIYWVKSMHVTKDFLGYTLSNVKAERMCIPAVTNSTFHWFIIFTFDTFEIGMLLIIEGMLKPLLARWLLGGGSHCLYHAATPHSRKPLKDHFEKGYKCRIQSENILISSLRLRKDQRWISQNGCQWLGKKIPEE